MRIDNIKITNFKNFSEANLHFEKGVNLLVGSNGSGKTSILEAINVAIGAFFGSQEQKLHRVIEFDEIKITRGIRARTSTIAANTELIGKEWSRTIKKSTKANDKKLIKSASDYGYSFFNKFEDPNDETVAPILAFYSTQRLFKDAYLSGKQKYDVANGRRNGYLQCLKENAIKSVINEWLGNAVTKRATLQIKKIENIDFVLDNVEQAIKKTLITLLHLPANFNLEIYQDPYFDNELFVSYDKEHNLPISYYSDGFRNILYLIIDIVWRISQLNPWLSSLEEISEKAFGVITIDEIDLHLHPKWQAQVISLIQLLFPNIQFFITTHSPTVVANFQNGSLYIIDNSEVNKCGDKYFGKQINNILRNILGASDRHIPTQHQVDLLFRYIDENNREQYTPLLQSLIDLLGMEDAEISRAIALISWQESIQN